MLAAVAALVAAPATAERASYGAVDLNGLLREQTLSQGIENAMVWNVNGPDGYPIIRSDSGNS